MNDLVLLCLIFFIFVRIIGLGVSIDFFYDTKDTKFIYFTLGWIFWIIAAFFPILASINENNYLSEAFLVLNALFAALGGIFCMWGLFKYFLSIQSRLIISIIIISIVMPIFLYFTMSFKISIQFSSLVLNLTIASTYVIIPLKRKNFKKDIGKSIRWFYATILLFFILIPISIIISLSDESYGLYDSVNQLLIMLNYVPTISSTLLLIILLVHLEYNISSRQKFELKDNFSHSLGNIIQAIQSSSGLINLSASLNTQEASNLELIRKKCKEASKLIKEIRKL